MKNDLTSQWFQIHLAILISKLLFEAKDDFEGIFDGMRFDSSDLGSNAQARASVMISMIELLSAPEFDLSTGGDTVSDIYEYLLEKFATVLASDMGQYYTPKEISEVMARILTFGKADEDNFSIYDRFSFSLNYYRQSYETFESKGSD